MSEQDNKTEEVSTQQTQELPFLDGINEKELEIMELRLQGLTHKEIAEKIDMSYYNLVELFRSRGKLHVPYQKYKEWKIKKIRDSAVEYGKLNVKKAMKALVDIMEDTEAGAGRVSAAKEIIDRVLGKVPNVNVNFDNAEYDEAAEIFKDVINKMK